MHVLCAFVCADLPSVSFILPVFATVARNYSQSLERLILTLNKFNCVLLSKTIKDYQSKISIFCYLSCRRDIIESLVIISEALAEYTFHRNDIVLVSVKSKIYLARRC